MARMTTNQRKVLRICLLGAPRVVWDSQAVPIARRQTRALLYCLAAENQPVARGRLCYLFWPDVADASARRNLTRLLVLLRHALPRPDAVLADDAAVWLDDEQVVRDTVEFEHFLKAAQGLDRRVALRQAAECVRGPFLDGFALPYCPEFESWMEHERRFWEQRTLDTLAALIELHTAAHDYAAAIAAAQHYLRIDPLAEEIHRRLLALHAAVGDRAAVLRQYEHCAATLERELGVAPLPATRALAMAVRDGTLPLPSRALETPTPVATQLPPMPNGSPRSVYGLPVPLNALIGRARELAEVVALLRRADVRLLTLSGPGGSGKTRLALAAAQAVAASFGDGAMLVPLASLRDAALVIPTIANVLGLSDQGDRSPLVRLQEVLRERHMLLVLDNFEHVAAATVDIAALLAAAPRLTLLVTSRTLLHSAAEHCYGVSPLALADPERLPPLDALAEVDAVALFLARVQALLPEFRLTESNAGAVAAICARLDGLPLAIELAAARAVLLSPAALLARLDRRLALLTNGPHDLPERQRTLRATIDWSYHLLDLSEQLLFGRLAVFAGSWSLEAAEAVAVAVGPLATTTLDGVQALRHQHLIQRQDDVGGEPRFALLETIREYALERLGERSEAQLAQQAHARHFLALAEAAVPALHGPQQIAWFDRLEVELPNLRVALSWFWEAGRGPELLRLATALHWFWHVRGYVAEGRAWLERALTAAADTPPIAPLLRAQALDAVGLLMIDQGDLAAAQQQLEIGVELLRALERDPAHTREAQLALVPALGRLFQARDMRGDRTAHALFLPEILARVEALADPWLDAHTAFHYGRGHMNGFGDAALAQPHLLRAQQLFAALGDTWHQAQVLADLGLCAVLLGHHDAARGYYELAHAAACTLKERALEAGALCALGEGARLTGDDGAAHDYYLASLRIYRNLDMRLEIARLIHNLAYLALHSGDTVLAYSRFSESLTLFRTSSRPSGQAECLAGLAAVAAQAQTAPDTQRAARLWGAAAAFHGAHRTPTWPVDQAEIARYQALARATLGAAAFDAAYAEGATLDLGQALAEALHL